MTLDFSQGARLQAVFAAALEHAEGAREAFIAAECAGDPALLERVRDLLDADARMLDTTVRPLASSITTLLATFAGAETLVGMRIGAYVLREELGRGGMGSVYRAERDDGVVRQQVAIKFVRRELLDAETRRRFQLERRVLASLDHPNIARLFDAAELEDGTPYYVMEYVAGTPIDEHCERAGLDARARAGLLRKVCGAVAHAHRALVVHRDLKPGNILVDADGHPKLLDFGIAKALGPGTDQLDNEQTGTAQRYFSPLYAAPEQLLGTAIGVGCDVYALGLLLYELLALRRPFDFSNLSPGDVERLVVSVPPPSPSACAAASADFARLPRQAQADLDGIVLRCLRKSPAERYPSVEQLDADLGNFLDGRPVHARGGHRLYRLRKFVGRHRLPVAFGVGAAVSLLFAAASLAYQNIALTRERDRAQYALDVLKNAFTSADPGRTAGDEITARQILDAARPGIEATYDTQPELYASLASTVAEVQLAMGQAADAAELAERALAAAQKTSMEPAAVASLLVLSAKSAASAGNLDTAESRLAQAAALGADSSPDWRLAQGRVLGLRGRAKEAVTILSLALESIRSRPPTDLLATTIRWQLADAWRRDENFERGLAVLDDALDWQRGGLPPSHPRIALTRLRRIDMLRYSGRNEEALTEATAVVSAVRRFYGDETALTGTARNALGGVLDKLGKGDAALREYRAAREALRTSLGDLHQNTLRATFNLAGTLAKTGRHSDEADRLYRTAIAGAAARLDPAHELLLYFRMKYGEFLLELDRPKAALAALAVSGGLEGVRAAGEDNRIRYLQRLDQARVAAGCDAPGRLPESAWPSDSRDSACDRAAEWLATPP